jgi:hypothetical protein
MANLTLPRGKRGRPIIRTTDDMMDYWGERITAVAPEREHQSRSSIIMEGDTLYHYGHHFPLATIYRRSNGRAYLVLLNGDEWTGGSAGFGTGTWQRQSQTRSIVARETAGTNIVSLVVPFSAVDAAGIVRESIRILDSREDRYETIHHESDERPGPLVKIPDPTGQTYVWSEQRHGHVHRETGEVFKTGWVDGKYIYSVPSDVADQYTWTTYTHIEDRPVMVDDPNRAHVERQIQHEFVRGDAELQSDGKWHWTAERHWLGDALLSATVREFDREAGHTRERRAKFLSSFDYNEPRPLYFLCEMPRTSARTIADALEALKPKTVWRPRRLGWRFCARATCSPSRLRSLRRNWSRGLSSTTPCARWSPSARARSTVSERTCSTRTTAPRT